MIAYLDLSSGVSGDMLLGALLSAGVDENLLQRELKKIPLKNWEMNSSRVLKNGISGLSVEIKVLSEQPERNLPDILRILNDSDLKTEIKEQGEKVFRLIAEVEAGIHACSVDEIHFHEIGAVDSIIDIVGSLIGFDLLGVNEIIASPVHLGTGFTECQHGRIPVPAPATVELLRGIPVYSTGIKAELTTPTGAALVRTLCDSFQPLPEMIIESVGYGAGSRDLPIPNLLRIIIGDPVKEKFEKDEVVVIETNLDDMNPEIIGYLSEKLLKLGSLDVFLTPLQMKKNRPGTMLTILTSEQLKNKVISILFEETSTFGVRLQKLERRKLSRKFETVRTEYGPIRIKVGYLGEKIIKAQPEYEDCRLIAEEKKIPLEKVYEAARTAWSVKE